jgi:serine/threonine protein kinase
MDCLDANAVQDLMSGALDTTARAVAVQHLDGCEDCRSLVSLLARDVTRTAAIDTLRDADLDPALRATDPPDVKRLIDGKPNFADMKVVETVTSAASPRSADVSLIMKSGTRQVGKTFGRYTLVERIGAGAMGVVYKADDPGLNRRVALKLLHKPDAALTDRLIREARSMAQVNHPNVVQVYDAGVSEGSTYIAMELVTGQSLRSWQQTKHTMAEVIEMYVAAGRGLAAAHAAGIIHRDFKPDNVLVGTDQRVRVTDFGLASARPSEDVDGGSVPTELELTQSGMVLGTPAYMSPEQFTGGNIDPRTDQFNFCVALYEALYGKRPFKGKTFEELGDNVCDGKVTPPPRDSHVSGELRAILLKGLSVRPGDRYATMEDLLEDLARDRTRRWRMAAITSTILAGTLGLALAADFVVRDRISDENDQSFKATVRQVERAFQLLFDRFDANGNQMHHMFALRELTNYRDQFDFGLRSEEDDARERDRIRELLLSTDWDQWQFRPIDAKSKPNERPLSIGIADYKGRLFYTSAAKDADYFLSDLTKVGWFKEARDEHGVTTMVLQPTTDPALAGSQLLGKQPTFELAFLYSRTLFVGADNEPSTSIIQAGDAKELVEDIRLDDESRIAVVAPGGMSASSPNPNLEMPAELVAAATRADVGEVEHNGVPYQVKRQDLKRDGRLVGSVVMARELGGVLSGIFPGARTVFATAALLALAIAIATMIQVRRLTR